MAFSIFFTCFAHSCDTRIKGSLGARRLSVPGLSRLACSQDTEGRFPNMLMQFTFPSGKGLSMKWRGAAAVIWSDVCVAHHNLKRILTRILRDYTVKINSWDQFRFVFLWLPGRIRDGTLWSSEADAQSLAGTPHLPCRGLEGSRGLPATLAPPEEGRTWSPADASHRPCF